jgi:hypothetical protein
MLELRRAEGIDAGLVDADRTAQLAGDGLLDVREGRAVLTLAGRRLADGVVRALA